MPGYVMDFCDVKYENPLELHLAGLTQAKFLLTSVGVLSKKELYDWASIMNRGPLNEGKLTYPKQGQESQSVVSSAFPKPYRFRDLDDCNTTDTQRGQDRRDADWFKKYLQPILGMSAAGIGAFSQSSSMRPAI